MEAPQKAPLPVPTGFEQCPSSLQCPQAALEPAVPLVAAGCSHFSAAGSIAGWISVPRLLGGNGPAGMATSCTK